MSKRDHHSKFFPNKLRAMLDNVEGLDLSHASSWVSDGNAFAVHDSEIFMSDVAPIFFKKLTLLRSFHRQLSIWGFTRVETGAAWRGIWHNKYFKRDQPELMKHMKRIPVKKFIQEQRIPTTTCSVSNINSEELNTARHQLMLSMVHQVSSQPNPLIPSAHQYLAAPSSEQQGAGRLPTIIFPQRNVPQHPADECSRLAVHCSRTLAEAGLVPPVLPHHIGSHNTASFHTAPSSSSTPSASVAFDRYQSDVILPNNFYQHQEQRPFLTSPLPLSLGSSIVSSSYYPGTIAQRWLLECSRNPTCLIGSEHDDTGDNITLRLNGCKALLPAFLNSCDHRNSNVNAAYLVSILEDRRHCTGTSIANAVGQDLLAALAWRELQRQRGP